MTASTSEPQISVVVLAFNEEDNLSLSSQEILATLKALGVSWEVIIVNDGSHDATGDIANEIARPEATVRVVHHPANLGLGGGYRTGFREARGEWVTFYAADGQYPADIIRQFLSATNGVDMVVGYLAERRHGVANQILSAAERALYRALFGKLPRYQGVMLFRRQLLAEIPLISEGRGWAIVMELLIRASRARYRILSIPTLLRPRRSGASKVNNLGNIVSNLLQIWRLSRRL